MLTKDAVADAARRLGFEDVGFTTVEPFDRHREYLEGHREEYGWIEAAGLDLVRGADPRAEMPSARTIIVLMEVYFREAYPKWMEGHFGRCYLDDDRVTKDGLSRRIKAFRSFLGGHGVDSKVPPNLPHRAAAARAGLGTLGRNCLFYSGRVARRSSWVLPIAVAVDAAFEPDEPTFALGCPEWCRNACIAACPTRALKGDGTLDPRRCISFLSYYGQGLTPARLREPMGIRVYGCDRCQDVCPRNAGWLAAELAENPRVRKKAPDFELPRLLHMDAGYFLERIRPHMFYMPVRDLWRWKMNVARAMGNSGDPAYVGDLGRALAEAEDERVRAMAAWALGRLGGPRARAFLENRRGSENGVVAAEIAAALARMP
jgi:epoxyqueuosine reductase